MRLPRLGTSVDATEARCIGSRLNIPDSAFRIPKSPLLYFPYPFLTYTLSDRCDFAAGQSVPAGML